MFIFDKEKFKANASENAKLKLKPYLSTLNGKKIDFSSNDRFGEYCYTNSSFEEICIYPINKEWCVEH